MAAPSIHVKVGGVWRTSEPSGIQWVKVGGTWRSMFKVYVKVGGTWRLTWET